MARVLSYILVIAALIIQIGMGALPPGDVCLCIPFASAGPACCCDDEDGGCPATAERCCPCNSGCERCIRVPAHDGRAMLTARPQTKFGHGLIVSSMLFGTPAPAPVSSPQAICAAPRATESPPHLMAMRTTRLII